jgi:CheY-like chemotaxis protein
MDGYEVARRLRDRSEADQPLQLIAVTGYGRDSDREHALRAGFDHHMVKPIDVGALESMISGAA